jgi:hypothetical protein
MSDADIDVIAYSGGKWKTTRFLLQMSFRDGAATTVAFTAVPESSTSLDIPQRVS